MSMPKFPSNENTPSREEAINQILSSIAMEELGLSHIINAEGEKLQYVLGTLEGTTGPENVTVEDVLNVNASVQSMLETTAYNQMFLKGKMNSALSAATLQGPTGATGLMGSQGTAAVQPFIAGTGYLAGDLVEYDGEIYLANVDDPTGTPGTSADYTLLSIIGPTGPAGATGALEVGDPLVTVGVSGSVDPFVSLNYGDELIFDTNTPDAVAITVTEGSTIVTIDVENAIGATGIAPTVTFDDAGNIIIDGVTGPNLIGPTGSIGSTGATGPAPDISFDDAGDIIIDGVTGPNLMGPTGPAIGLTGTGGGAIVNFQNGIVDWTNPLTWPIILDVLQLSGIENQLTALTDNLTTTNGIISLITGVSGGVAGLANEIDPTGLTVPVLETTINTALAPVSALLTPLQTAISAVSSPLAALESAMSTDDLGSGGLASMDAYIGHANVGIVPAIATGQVPVLDLVAGPPYPQIIARDGMITSFAAEFDTLVALDASFDTVLQGAIETLGTSLGAVSSATSEILALLPALVTALQGIGAPIAPNYADEMNNLYVSSVNAGTPSGNQELHAVLWHGTAEPGFALNGAVTWNAVADINLGLIPWAQLAPLDSILGTFGDLTSAAGNLVSAAISLLASRGTATSSVTNTPFVSGVVSGLTEIITAGDYLMIQFTIEGDDNTTVLSGVAAPNAMASVTIEEIATP